MYVCLSNREIPETRLSNVSVNLLVTSSVCDRTRARACQRGMLEQKVYLC